MDFIERINSYFKITAELPGGSVGWVKVFGEEAAWEEYETWKKRDTLEEGTVFRLVRLDTKEVEIARYVKGDEDG